MVTANKSQKYQQFSARNLSYLDRMALPKIEKNYHLPFFPLPKHTCDASFLYQADSNLPGLNTGQQDAVSGLHKPVSQYCNIPNLFGNPYPNRLMDKLFDAPQKRFLIFDRSGDQTRLFFGPSFSPPGPISASKIPAGSNGPTDLAATQLDQRFLVKPIVEEKSDENHLTDGEEDEMLEDSEEIDALLYSDSDDDEYDVTDGEEGEYDDVTSMWNSPFVNIWEGRDRTLDDEQVASSDWRSSKRRRLLDGKYKKSSLESPMKRIHYEDDVEWSCAGYRNPSDDIGSDKRENKVRIRRALKILETIMPGLDSKDPISIIDKAVAYLKSMKTEAEALGLGYPTP